MDSHHQLLAGLPAHPISDLPALAPERGGSTENGQDALRSTRCKILRIGAKVVSHGRYTTFQMAEVAVPRQMFQEILSLIARLRAPPAPA